MPKQTIKATSKIMKQAKAKLSDATTSKHQKIKVKAKLNSLRPQASFTTTALYRKVQVSIVVYDHRRREGSCIFSHKY